MKTVILLILLSLVACGGGGGGGDNATPAGSAPRISNLSLSPDSVAYMDGNGTTQISAQLDFTDPDLDIATAWIELSDGSRQSIALPAINTASGTLTGELIVSTAQLGVFTSQVWLVDRAGHTSNRLTVDLSVVVDFTTWLQRAANLQTGLNDVVWNGSQFVAVGDGGAIVTSPDGITWTSRASGTNQILNSVYWDGSRFLAVGNGATILSSANGVTWATLHTGADEIWLQAISFSGTRYVAAGSINAPNSTYVLTSTDGNTWAQNLTVPQAGQSISDLAWSGQLFVATTVANGLVLVSQDGLTWVEVIISATSPATLSIIWDGSQFIAGGIGGRLFISPDGMNWTLHATPSTANILGIAASDTTLIADGVVGSGVATSDGGGTWQLFGISGLYDTHGLAYGANRFVSVGSGGGVIYTTR